MSTSLPPHGLQHTRLSCPSPSLGVCSNSCPLSQWCHPTISSSVAPFSCSQSFLASRSFPMSWFFASDDQSIGASASASVLPMSIQGWSLLGWTGWISLLSSDSQESSPAPQFKGSNSLVFHFVYGPSLTIIRDHWEDDSLDYMDFCQQSTVSAFQHSV